MKRKLIIFSFLLFTLSVVSQKSEFQNSFGKVNTENLDLLLFDFESKILKKKYPNQNIQNSYRSYLKDFFENKIELNKDLLLSGEKILEKNNLKFHIYNVIDSIWVGKSVISETNEKVLIAKYKHLNTKGEFDYMISETSQNDLNLKLEISKKYKKVNLNGKYFESLKKASLKSELLKPYVENMNLSGSFMSPLILANNILNNKVDLNNYFVKVIILTNIVYR
ncbi:hypothetical protein [Polaribacter sp. Asnod1-A03]|uniref:hypothetical protein n=1 Tax=Polaribacter sp. Asnod1-A03 TaxID=3160581 RepID=UPI0038697735